MKVKVISQGDRIVLVPGSVKKKDLTEKHGINPDEKFEYFNANLKNKGVIIDVAEVNGHDKIYVQY